MAQQIIVAHEMKAITFSIILVYLYVQMDIMRTIQLGHVSHETKHVPNDSDLTEINDMNEIKPLLLFF